MKDYIIPENWHYCLNFLPCIRRAKDTMVFSYKVMFTESCRYHIDEPSCVNKLFGFCYGFGVHKNSVRFGWTWDKYKETIVLWSYIYKHGVLHKKKILLCDIGEKCCLTIQVTSNKIELKTKEDSRALDTIYMDKKSCFITKLGPYFGGNSRAPHKIIIKEL